MLSINEAKTRNCQEHDLAFLLSKAYTEFRLFFLTFEGSKIE